MKKMIVSILALTLVNTAFATTTKITCAYKWKNTDAKENSFSFKVKDLRTPKAEVVISPNEDGEMVKSISGIKASKHDADIALIEVAMETTAEVYTSAKEDITIQMGDGTSTEAFIKLYKNSNYRSGFMTITCDPSYCGKFDFYATLKCK